MRPSPLSCHDLVVLGIDPGLRATGWAVLALSDTYAAHHEPACPSAGGGFASGEEHGRRVEGPKGSREREELSVLGYGAVTTEPGVPLPERLCRLAVGLREVIGRWQPAEAAVEEAFVAANKRVAIAMGEARGVALLAAAEAGLPVFEYSASEVKQAVAGYGRGSKEQVQEMLRLQLGLEAAPQPADAADALATALCHLMRRRTEARVAGATTSSGGSV
jgi:crossover junction endodeoxyribonuclease RuvC